HLGPAGARSLKTGIRRAECYDDATRREYPHFHAPRGNEMETNKEKDMERGTLSRRGFLQRSLAGLTVGAGLPLWFAREVLAQQEERVPRKRLRAAANDRVLICAIVMSSPGGRSEQLMHDVLGLKRPIQYVAVCDV